LLPYQLEGQLDNFPFTVNYRSPQQIVWADGNWIFLDIGFSGTQKTWQRN